MKVLYSNEFELKAEKDRRTLAYDRGYADGKEQSARGDAPGSFVRIGIDDYSLGFRAGYFEREAPDTVYAERGGVAANAPSYIRAV